ncbi:hypothetical protein SAMN05216490_4187 [Mucilaginibacter mallensis]|uniref:Uncharacterized protein n=1 Tax=Mucilaginibacter mallensis TaxID=652787 RepID=A0A1H2BM52_MUCMA|nr:hypothetical protein SAMN05216490_4187 [Mucilaginibacter mallensis]
MPQIFNFDKYRFENLRHKDCESAGSDYRFKILLNLLS